MPKSSASASTARSPLCLGQEGKHRSPLVSDLNKESIQPSASNSKPSPASVTPARAAFIIDKKGVVHTRNKHHAERPPNFAAIMKRSSG
jgi:hypothetical protein